MPTNEIQELIDDVKKLKKNKCCCIVYFTGETPTTGKKYILYVNEETGAAFVWNGSTYVSVDGGGITDVTYAELVALIGSSGLTEGAQYRITDFATRHFLIDPSDGNNQDTSVSFTGDTEPIVVLATSSNTISNIATSSLFPQDVIYYDWNPYNWLTDAAFADLTNYDYVDRNTATIISGFKGVIYFRHDTKRNNKFGYDFRNVFFRRYKSDPPAWDSGTTYNLGDAVKYTSSLITKVYTSLRDSNLNQIPEQILHSNYWIETIDLTKTDKWAYGPTSHNIVPVDSNSFQDIKTFYGITNADTYELLVSNNDFTPSYSDITWTRSTILNNTVYYIDGDMISNNKFDLIHSTLYSGCYSNKVTGFKNIISKNFNDNNFHSFSNNLVGDGCASNSSFSNQFLGNWIDGSFGGNTFTANSSFVNNLVGYGFGGNQINQHNVGNLIGKNFISNIVDGDMTSLDFTADFIRVTGSYSKRIYRNSSSILRLEYTDGSDVLTVVNPTA